MKNLCRKLKSSAGETISEVLIALLISSLGLVMLAGMITAASNAVTTSRKTLETYYNDSAPEVGDLTVTLQEGSSSGFPGTASTYTLTYVEKKLSGKDIVYYYFPTPTP